MENILPVSDLRFYNQTLASVENGTQVILTKNGKAKYVVTDFDEWQEMKATLALFTELNKGIESYRSEERLSIEDLSKKFRVSEGE